MNSICCIGHITRDRIITQRPPKTTHCAGGTAYYVAWAFASLPRDVDFGVVTSISREVMPEVEKLRHAGIDVTAYESQTNVFFENSYGVNMDNRTQRVLAKSEPFTIEQLKDVKAEVFHLGTLLADDFAPEVVEYLATKGDISIDVQGYMRYVKGEQVLPTTWGDKQRLLKNTAILKVNEFEYQSLTGLSNPHAAAEQIHDWGVREVIITLGGGGSLIFAEGQFYETPAFPPRQTVDATGCGDTYSAGYLYGRAKGMDYAESGRFAAAMCTLKLEHTGPFNKTIDDIRNIIGNSY
ncbi:MAG: bifunctional hydroxymethylpyrimidine kinase/phosphomethylpyrimidine kinase [Prevotella sp.]|nr:bifunctional hydroxymethylpyrimidine kinase/phosphomethylpyrimidine kinase [Prevotella sp.]